MPRLFSYNGCSNITPSVKLSSIVCPWEEDTVLNPMVCQASIPLFLPTPISVRLVFLDDRYGIVTHIYRRTNYHTTNSSCPLSVLWYRAEEPPPSATSTQI